MNIILSPALEDDFEEYIHPDLRNRGIDSAVLVEEFGAVVTKSLRYRFNELQGHPVTFAYRQITLALCRIAG